MNKKIKTLVSIAFVIVLVSIAHASGLFRPVENIIIYSIERWSKPFYAISEDSRMVVASKKELAQMVREYQSQAQQALIDSSRLELLEEENRELRAQHDFLSAQEYPSIGADVIGRTLDPLATIIRVNKGTQDGIFVGNPVVIHDGILIGKVYEAFGHSSLVRLINDNASSIGSMIMNGDKSIGLVEGGYGLGVRMNLIPQNEVVTPGDIIVTSGLSKGMPRGLVIGTIELVEKQPHEPFQQAVIRPLADFSYITAVSIIGYPTFD